MANEITVTISESWTGNTGTVNSTHTHQVSDIVDIYKRIVSVPSGTDTTIATFDDAVSDGVLTAFDLQVVEYIRVTNIHGSNPVNLQLIIDNSANGAADASATVYLKAGDSWMHWNPDAGIVVRDDAATYEVADGDLLGLVVDSISAASLVEIVVASKTAA
tara:strand:+ start:723 stop:1205 length:483 start_codon:yes stop_codon:yes gene_type:complete